MPSIDYDSAAEVTEQLEERLVESLGGETSVDRRTVLGRLGVAGSIAVGLGSSQASAGPGHDDEGEHGNFGAVDEYRDTEFDPHEFLTAFNTGRDGQDNVLQRIYEENGRTVTWTNTSDVGHTVTAYEGEIPDGAAYFASGGFESERATKNQVSEGFIALGDEYEHAFGETGTYEYYCIPHESSGMVGTVHVK